MSTTTINPTTGTTKASGDGCRPPEPKLSFRDVKDAGDGRQRGSFGGAKFVNVEAMMEAGS